jgi:hypothetical protein
MAKSKKKDVKKANGTNASVPAKKQAKMSEHASKAIERDAQARTTAPAVALAQKERDQRLPPAVTTLKKVDRNGAIRCECKVEGDGIHYGGKVYRSLSAAAMAAAKDLGLGGSQNGYLFWGLVRQPRRVGDPLVALDRAWRRYHGRATSIIEGVTDENRDKVRVAIEKQAKEIGNIVASVA